MILLIILEDDTVQPCPFAPSNLLVVFIQPQLPFRELFVTEFLKGISDPEYFNL